MNKEEKELLNKVTYEDLDEIEIFREEIKPVRETEMFESRENMMMPKPKNRKRNNRKK